MVRVIAGSARGRKLKTLEKDTTKPTLDRVKEAMFSMIFEELPNANVLDLFSGNGTLGIEALSRGAKFCVFNDFSGECCKIIRENIETVGFQEKSKVICNSFDATLNSLAKSGEKFDVILMDPPYSEGLYMKTLSSESLSKISKDGKTIVVCEHSFEDKFPEEIQNFVMTKDKKYGTVGVTVYRYNQK